MHKGEFWLFDESSRVQIHCVISYSFRLAWQKRSMQHSHLLVLTPKSTANKLNQAALSAVASPSKAFLGERLSIKEGPNILLLIGKIFAQYWQQMFTVQGKMSLNSRLHQLKILHENNNNSDCFKWLSWKSFMNRLLMAFACKYDFIWNWMTLWPQAYTTTKIKFNASCISPLGTFNLTHQAPSSTQRSWPCWQLRTSLVGKKRCHNAWQNGFPSQQSVATLHFHNITNHLWKFAVGSWKVSVSFSGWLPFRDYNP